MRPPHAESTLTGRVPGAGLRPLTRPSVVALPRDRAWAAAHGKHSHRAGAGRVPGGGVEAATTRGRRPPPLHLGPLRAPPPRCGVPALQHAGKC